jgi:hypothetical protein
MGVTVEVSKQLGLFFEGEGDEEGARELGESVWCAAACGRCRDGGRIDMICGPVGKRPNGKRGIRSDGRPNGARMASVCRVLCVWCV